MSKLIDNLTGYFFPGEHVTASSIGGSAGSVAATADSVESDSADLTQSAFDAQFKGEGLSPPVRLRDRLWLRRPVRRTAPAMRPGAQKPWGDDEVASPRIHPLAVIDRRAELAADVAVGPFCVIGPNVTIGPGCRLHNNVTIAGHTTIGSDNEIFPNAVLGAAPQDKKYKGESTRLLIGDGNVFREAVTIHVGTEQGGGITRVGDRNLLMVNAHLGHDVTLGNECVFANNVMLAGHCHIGNGVSIMGAGGLHHFVTVGDLVFIGAYSKLRHDVPPYMKVDGPDQIRGVNVVGLRRAGIANADIAELESAARELFYAKQTPMSVALAKLAAQANLNPRVREVVDFLRRRNLGVKGRYLESRRNG